jgi:peptide/nickel transport system permease protein
LLSSQSNVIDLEAILQVPGNGHLLGADDLGRSVWQRLIAGSQVSIMIAVLVTVVSSSIGIVIGAFAAWFGGWVDRVLMIVVDTLMAFPGILLAIALAGILGPGLGNLLIALTVTGWVGYARLVRAQILSLKSRDHVVAASALGVTESVIVFRHLIPLAFAPLLIEATFGMASIIIAEAGLSFLGLGVQAPDASWGSMIKDGVRYMLIAPHLVIVPGLALFSLVMAINLLGDQMRDHLDIKEY